MHTGCVASFLVRFLINQDPVVYVCLIIWGSYARYSDSHSFIYFVHVRHLFVPYVYVCVGMWNR